MNVDEAIASFLSYIETDSSHAGKGIPELPIFFLGDAKELVEAQESLVQELRELLKERTPCPFEGQLLLFILDGRWNVVSVVQPDVSDKRRISVVTWFYGQDRAWHHLITKERTARYEALTGKLNSTSAFVDFAAYTVAFISHPANYVVKETPQLTPHEARRIENGKRFPDAKRPRYIIVDHEVLVNRLKPQGTHQSPAPHQRRGHWMRLAEHCKHALARGVERVWVKDCNVGETDFVVNNRRYQVLLNFHEGQRI